MNKKISDDEIRGMNLTHKLCQFMQANNREPFVNSSNEEEREIAVFLKDMREAKAKGRIAK